MRAASLPGAAFADLARLGTQAFVGSRAQDVLAELIVEPPAKLADLVRPQKGAAVRGSCIARCAALQPSCRTG